MGSKDFYLSGFLLVVVIWSSFGAQALNNPLHRRLMICHPSDLRALQSFMAALWTKPNGWEEEEAKYSSNCCEWEGVTCNSSSSLGLQSPNTSSSSDEIGRVVKLQLPSKRLFGKLSESLGSLDQLRALNLSHNFLTSSLPVSLFNLSRLRVLDLSVNRFYGPVPDVVNLPSIQYLDISENNLNGSLPGRICTGGSSALRVLNLATNYFSGEVPSGFGDCGSLEHLCVGMNDLSGVSEDLFQLRKLSDLILADNRLSGPLSLGFGNLTNLLRLDISTNGFSGTIPNVFQRLGRLVSFVAHSNRFTGNIPVSLSNSPTISTLNLRNNSLEGTIELNCSAMVNLTSLDLAINQFSGLIPRNLPSCRHLNYINLARNNFIGEIPQSFKDFHSLSYFSLSNTTNTNLPSALRILQHCKNLTTLVLSINFRNDELPQDPDLHFERLKILVIANCGLRGSVPQWLRKSEKLHLLDLSWNSLAGTIPGWLGGFQLLFYLDLSNNYFIGEIPRNLTALPSLINRVISIEEPLPDFPFFMKWNANSRGLQYNQVWSFPPTLDLSCNNLSGPIWPEFGNMRILHVFDLKVNNLSGEIPPTLSGMSRLETLDLSYNSLSGTIPPSLGILIFLSKFSVAHNNLHGPIPTRGQLATFTNSSFEGNNLCGDQASSCDITEKYIPSQGSTGDSDFADGLTVGMGVGMAFGLVIGIALFQAISRNYSPFKKLWLDVTKSLPVMISRK